MQCTVPLAKPRWRSRALPVATKMARSKLLSSSSSRTSVTVPFSSRAESVKAWPRLPRTVASMTRSLPTRMG